MARVLGMKDQWSDRVEKAYNSFISGKTALADYEAELIDLGFTGQEFELERERAIYWRWNVEIIKPDYYIEYRGEDLYLCTTYDLRVIGNEKEIFTQEKWAHERELPFEEIIRAKNRLDERRKEKLIR